MEATSTRPNLGVPDGQRPCRSENALNFVFSVEVMMPPSVAVSYRSKFQFFISCRLYGSAKRTSDTSRRHQITASSHTHPIARSLRCNFFFSVIFLPRVRRSLSKQILTQRCLAPQENAFPHLRDSTFESRRKNKRIRIDAHK